MKEYPTEIKLYNRYRENVYLKYIKDNKYKLMTPSPYIRCGLKDNDEKSYSFVDPSGGPFISENGTIEEYMTNIKYNVGNIYDEDEKLIVEINL